ncbi:LOW QUALITY PROTEIN: solute carrier family 2, facilitated glucose transporter member 6-like [Drosophila albomicans]|uniref:LOW QUALITY PROTEIN: solute carrier family 2, facilitated glucose transporter member 6-like n=1 Tax=Drosophila albomicans TaxID=7291 RepID=A0A6P8W591_DROAB|nr:LOW QUALITY PROTEIN: solute carrier family 2, facilitated glucose transporter member 6-like [Drosophila albomicans]
MVKTKQSDKTEDESSNYLPLFMQKDYHNQNSTEQDDEEVSDFRRALPQIIAVNIQNLLQFGYGMTQGFPTIAIPAIQSSLDSSAIKLDKEAISWLSSINLICMPLGCLFSGMFAQYLGKRRAMQLINLPMLAAWLLFHYASCTEHMYVALCFVGIGGGLMEAAVITYVAEITDPKYRGMFSALATTCVSLGVFTEFLLGSLLNWRTVAIVSTVIPLFSMAMLCFVPESPVWLIRERRFFDAVKALQWLRGWVPEQKVEAEFKQLYDELITQKSARKSNDVQESRLMLKKKLHMWRKRSFIMPFLLVLLTFFICHFSGKTPIRSYAVLIFATLKAPIDENNATILLGISELIATILGALFIHSTGKRPLVFISMLGTGVCILGVAIYAHSMNILEMTVIGVKNEAINSSMNVLEKNMSQLLNSSALLEGEVLRAEIATTEINVVSEIALGFSYLEWIPLILVLFAAFFANLGIRMIPWVLIGEVFPADIRSSASGFAGCMGYLFGFMANKLFLVMITAMTLPVTFTFFASVSFIGIIILYFTLPETEGRTLGEIEAHFSKKTDANLFRKRKNENVSQDDSELINIVQIN